MESRILGGLLRNHDLRRRLPSSPYTDARPRNPFYFCRTGCHLHPPLLGSLANPQTLRQQGNGKEGIPAVRVREGRRVDASLAVS